MSVELFQQASDGATAEMTTALDCFYPVEGDNDLPEALPAMYLCFQLSKAGFHVFPQCQVSGSKSEHLDFVAISPSRKMVIKSEGKKLYDGGRAYSLGKDWKRMQRISVHSKLRHISPDSEFFGCLTATTWKLAYKEWWRTKDRSWAPGQESADNWSSLKHALDTACLNSVHHVPIPRLGWKPQLYVLFSFIPMGRRAAEIMEEPSSGR